MEFEPQDQDIVRLLTKLKSAEGPYPEHMFVARRHSYIKRMAEIGMGISVDAGIRNSTPDTTPPAFPPVNGTLLETVLLVALVVEAGAVAYFYRDQLADWVQTKTVEPKVQEVIQEKALLPVVTTAMEIQGVMPSPVVTPTVPATVLSASPAGAITSPSHTPIPAVPGVADDGIGNDNAATGNSTTNPGNNPNSSTAGGTSTVSDHPTGSNTSGNSETSAPEDSPPASTPIPDSNDRDHDDQGNHYGQTPKPERTKENNGNNGNLPQETSPAPLQSIPSEAPVEDSRPGQGPKHEPKPTETK